MSNRSNKIKSIVKKRIAEPSKFGTNPMDPWSVKSNINEWKQSAALIRFLKSKGIDPRYISKDTMIGHSKSGEFSKWKQDHMLEEVDKKDVISMDIPLLIRVLELAREDIKDDMEIHRVVERLIDIRKKGTLTMDDYDFVAGLKEEIEFSENLEEDLRKWFKQKWVRFDTKGNIKGQCAREKGEGKPKCLPAAKAAALGKEKRASAAQRKRRQDPNADRRGKAINVKTEEFELLDEKNKPTQPEKWARAKAAAKAKFAVYPSAYANAWASKKYKSMGGGWRSTKEEIEEQKDAHISKTKIAFSKLHTSQHKNKEIPTPLGSMHKEDKYQDPQAATQTVGMEVENGSSSKQKEMSKSARMIKALYKKHRMVKEDTYDHEKADKAVSTYGRKPKMDKADEKDSMGENKPKAAAVMTGGTTLTGQDRDTIEIDPMMRVRPGQPDPTKKDDKNKGDDKKKDKKN